MLSREEMEGRMLSRSNYSPCTDLCIRTLLYNPQSNGMYTKIQNMYASKSHYALYVHCTLHTAHCTLHSPFRCIILRCCCCTVPPPSNYSCIMLLIPFLGPNALQNLNRQEPRGPCVSLIHLRGKKMEVEYLITSTLGK